MRMFVYGTLVHDFQRRPDATPAELRGFALHDLGPYPAIVPADQGAVVHGVVATITPTELTGFDRYEGYNREKPTRSLYIRQEVYVYTPALAQVYVFNHSNEARACPRVESGQWGINRGGHL